MQLLKNVFGLGFLSKTNTLKKSDVNFILEESTIKRQADNSYQMTCKIKESSPEGFRVVSIVAKAFMDLMEKAGGVNNVEFVLNDLKGKSVLVTITKNDYLGGNTPGKLLADFKADYFKMCYQYYTYMLNSGLITEDEFKQHMKGLKDAIELHRPYRTSDPAK